MLVDYLVRLERFRLLVRAAPVLGRMRDAIATRRLADLDALVDELDALLRVF
jgi:hypothetical protein